MKGNVENIRVGINADGYPEKRNIIDVAPFQIVKVRDLMKTLDYAYFRLMKKNHPVWHNRFTDAGLSRVHIFHFFNAISTGKRPWVVTFENELPRYNTTSRYLMEALARDACKKIIAISQNAFNIQLKVLENYPELKHSIISKMCVMHPPQKLQLPSNSIKNKTLTKIHFTFVGAAFFRKGGKQLLDAFLRLKKEKPEVHLHVVTTFAKDHWLDEEYGPADIDTCKKLINENAGFITHYNHLPNEAIIELLKKTNVAVFPSFGETYGYFTLEAQACGCPVITTNSWAFTECNNNERGWVLDLPIAMVNGGKRADIGTAEKKKAYSRELTDKIFKTMLDICNNPAVIHQKSLKCLEYIEENHSPEKYKEELAGVYLSALNKKVK
ncbi:MAG TPA: glycosyltransferase family 4 protein [Flavobacteriales bacterium]|nr:glycosyltransferase family 4 protein [Flavobacteriales bacterium]